MNRITRRQLLLNTANGLGGIALTSHLLGLDHKRLTYYHNGIERRLTDVHGNVIKDIVT